MTDEEIEAFLKQHRAAPLTRVVMPAAVVSTALRELLLLRRAVRAARDAAGMGENGRAATAATSFDTLRALQSVLLHHLIALAREGFGP